MEVTIEARHFNARDELQESAKREVNRLVRYFPRIVSAHVVLEGRLDKKEATVSIKVPEQTLVASDIADRFEIAVESSVDKLKQQLEKYKGKLRQR